MSRHPNLLSQQKLARVQCKKSKVCHDKVSYVATNPLKINNAKQEECRDIRNDCHDNYEMESAELCRDTHQICRHKY